MSSYTDPDQVATGGWDTDYYGQIPFHGGGLVGRRGRPVLGQPPSTNQQLKPTPVPLPTH